MTATTAVTDRPTRGHRRRSGWGIASVVVALACVPWLLDAYAIGQLNRIGALSLMAVSVAILTGTAGLPSVGQAAPFAVGAYTTYRLAEAGIVVGPVQVVVSAVVAMAFSAVVGVFVVRVRGVVFLMVTLPVGVLTAEAAGQWRAVTGGTDGTGRFDPSLPFWVGVLLMVTMYAMPDGLVGKAATVRRRLADSPWQQRLRRLLPRSVHLPDRTAS